ncbi:hypothetical protein BKA67DRAFT_425405 [Truncatella angustata]|uniref:Uncharacterized protein n=1 Tax=Truncatella angustata TaxID=152316 RepID=A0A9P8RPQ2_9PEZI|nr:uncharacterized protein BKA67DRAFT_425405 [Truncatella angustata]KAH6647065.1 hypothetical protein BKA67DRAFT_425405 [Truncatella angustata]
MELTPIRIPGKRRRKGEPPVVFHVPPRKDKHTAKRRKKPKVPKLKASYLEKKLPLEIMERILWMSENVNFAKSGARVGYLLSGESTRKETFVQAFGPTWDVWFGCVKNGDSTVVSYHDWQNDSARSGGSPDFQSQSALLQYSWVDINFILDCLDSWVYRFARNRFFQHQKLWGDPDSQHQLDDDSGDYGNFKSARQYFLHDYDAFCSNLDDDLPPPDLQPSWMEVHHETQIPDSLLTGPWDEDAMQKLFWLVRAGARLSADQTWETTLEGFHNAMANDAELKVGNVNLPVLRLLFILAGNHWPDYIANCELEKLQAIEQMLRDAGRRDAYRKYALVASMLLQRYSTSSSGT